MSIQSEIDRIKGAKTSLIEIINSKGVSVPDTAKIEELPAYAAQIDTGFKLVQLWENPSPGSEFSSKTLALGLGSYDFYVVSAAFSTTESAKTSSITPVGESVCVFSHGEDGLYVAGSSTVGASAVGTSYVGHWTAKRQATYSGGSLTFTDATIDGTVHNSLIIPVKIYGIIGEPNI